jgi:hypothetical protein
MLQLAECEGLSIVEIKRESHSAKETGQRPVFNEIVEEIKQGKFNGILTFQLSPGRSINFTQTGAERTISSFSLAANSFYFSKKFLF